MLISDIIPSGNEKALCSLMFTLKCSLYIRTVAVCLGASTEQIPYGTPYSRTYVGAIVNVSSTPSDGGTPEW